MDEHMTNIWLRADEGGELFAEWFPDAEWRDGDIEYIRADVVKKERDTANEMINLWSDAYRMTATESKQGYAERDVTIASLSAQLAAAVDERDNALRELDWAISELMTLQGLLGWKTKRRREGD